VCTDVTGGVDTHLKVVGISPLELRVFGTPTPFQLIDMLRIGIGLVKTDALLSIASARRMSSIPQYEGLKVEEKPSGVFSVELNRPESRNAFTLQQWKYDDCMSRSASSVGFILKRHR